MATKEIIVRQGQSLKDIASQYYGTVEKWFRVAELNNMRMTEIPAPGITLVVDDVTNETVKYLAAGKHIPATYVPGLLGGIGYMKIGDDFKVS